MDRRSRGFRLSSLVAGSGMLMSSCVSLTPARAQDASSASGDPPGRVGRIARLEGTVSSHGAGATQWTPAVLNFPVSSGDALWTQPQAQADLQVGDSLITLADSTELDVATLDDRNLLATEPQGALFLDLRDLRPGETYTINTPRGAVQIATPGEYEVLAGDSATPTRVVVVRGAAQLTAGTLALRAGQGQMAVATGAQDVQGDVEPLSAYDPFLTAMLAHNSAPATAPPAVQGMTGTQDLAQYGSWQNDPQYGQVWAPQVAPDWVPYRDGSWSYVAPWGWTWVDNEPWGFAPFHYGRWARLGQRWCWVPNQPDAPVDEQPAYAPALVDFIAAGAVVGVGAGLLAASLSSGRGDIGWVPLGPREAYAPPYGASRRYLSRLNRGGGWHRPAWGVGAGAPGGDRRGGGGFINRAALTVAPTAAMAGSRQIHPVAHGLGSPAARGFESASAQPVHGALPIRPVAETRGLTPQAAQRLGVGGAAAHAPAPGPAIRAGSVHPQSGRVGFRDAAAPTVTRAAARAPGPVAPRQVAPHAPVAPQPPVRPVAPAPSPSPSMRPQQPGTAPGPSHLRDVEHRAPAPHPPVQAPVAPRFQPQRQQGFQPPAFQQPAFRQPAFHPPIANQPAFRPAAPRPQFQAPRPAARPAPPPPGRPEHP